MVQDRQDFQDCAAEVQDNKKQQEKILLILSYLEWYDERSDKTAIGQQPGIHKPPVDSRRTCCRHRVLG